MNVHSHDRYRHRRIRLPAFLLIALLAPLGGCLEDEPAPLEPEPELSAAPRTSLSASSIGYLRPVGYAHVYWLDLGGRVQESATYNAAGDSVAVQIVQPGHVKVRFKGLATRINGLPHAQASVLEIGHHGVTCAVPAVVVQGSDVVMTVLCTRNGTLASYKFVAQLYDQDADAGFATINSQGIASNARGLSRVERTSTGRTRVYFRKDPLFGVGSYPNAAVTARQQGVSCQLFSIGSASQRADEFGVEVDCYNSAGNRISLGEFNVLLFAKSYRTAYAFVADGAVIDWNHSYNYSGRDITVEREGIGDYDVKFHGLAPHFYAFGTVKVTAHGASGEICRPWTYSPLTDGSLSASVACTDAEGRSVDSRFSVMVTSRY